MTEQQATGRDDGGIQSGQAEPSGTGLGAGVGRVTEAVTEKAGAATDEVRQQASASLSALAESVRKASDDYKASEPGLLADLMGHVAEGVDSLARTVGGKSTSDMVGTAREFGRRNPVGLLLGGVAAGFAISRLAVGMAASSRSGQPDRATGPVGEGDFRHDA